jgi:hypothetical protein
MDEDLLLRHRPESLRFLAASPFAAHAFSQNILAQGTPAGDPKFSILNAQAPSA